MPSLPNGTTIGEALLLIPSVNRLGATSVAWRETIQMPAIVDALCRPLGLSLNGLPTAFGT
jgi:hypothetical protein